MPLRNPNLSCSYRLHRLICIRLLEHDVNPDAIRNGNIAGDASDDTTPVTTKAIILWRVICKINDSDILSDWFRLCGALLRAANDKDSHQSCHGRDVMCVHKMCRCLTYKVEPPPTRGVNRDSGTASANSGWLGRFVRQCCHVVAPANKESPQIPNCP